MLVLVTFRFIGLAHLHSLWGCLAFVGFPSGFGLVGLGPCPLGFLFAVLVGFSLGCLHLRCGLGALASRRHGSFVPVGPSLSVFMACFRCGWLRLLLLWLPLALRRLFGGSSDQSSHTSSQKTQVFCQSAIESAQNDHSTKCQAILADKDRLQRTICTVSGLSHSMS